MEIRNIINTLVLNGPVFFFCIAALLGIRFGSEEEGGAGISYKLYMSILLLMGTLLFLRDFLNRRVFTIREVLPLVILFIYMVDGYIQGYETNLVYLKMVCFSLPATCVALNMKDHRELGGVIKWLDLFLPVFSASFVIMVYHIYLSRLEGEGTYDQNASYMIAFCFLIALFTLRYNDQYPKFSFLDKKWYRIFKMCLFPYFIIMAFFAGGRGAFVAMLFGLLLNVDLLKKINPQMMKKIVLGFIGGVVLLILILSWFDKNGEIAEFFLLSAQRITALVDFQNMDASSATSGRDELYADAIRFFSESPVYGYGLFAYLKKIEMFPHNIFLEIMLQGGLIFLTVFVFIMMMAYGKYQKMLQADKSQILLMPFFIYSFTELLFSSSYIFVPLFWFVLTYIYSFSFEQEQPECTE